MLVRKSILYTGNAKATVAVGTGTGKGDMTFESTNQGVVPSAAVLKDLRIRYALHRVDAQDVTVGQDFYVQMFAGASPTYTALQPNPGPEPPIRYDFDAGELVGGKLCYAGMIEGLTDTDGSDDLYAVAQFLSHYGTDPNKTAGTSFGMALGVYALQGNIVGGDLDVYGVVSFEFIYEWDDTTIEAQLTVMDGKLDTISANTLASLGLLQNPTFGLVALDTQIGAVQTDVTTIKNLAEGAAGFVALYTIVGTNKILLQHPSYGLNALYGILMDATYGLPVLDSQLDDIATGVSGISTDLGTVDTKVTDVQSKIGTPASPPDFTSLYNANETIYGIVASFAGGGLGERMVTQDGFLDGQVPPVFHNNGSGYVRDGEGNPLDDVTVFAYIETPGTDKWRTLVARTVTNAEGNWSLKLDDGIYILWFYRADIKQRLEWRAISEDGSVENPTTNPEDYV